MNCIETKDINRPKGKPHIRITSFIFVVSIFLLTLGLGTATAGNRTIKISYAHFDPPQSAFAPAMKGWADELKQRTNGQVQVEFLWAFARPGETLDMTYQGIIDMSFDAQGFYPGNFPYTQIMNLPFIIDSSEIGGKALTALANKGYLEKENARMKIIHLGTAQGDMLFTKDKPVTSMADIKGMKIFVGGPEIQKRVTLMGGIPVQLPFPEIYTALQKGIIDGYIQNWSLMETFRLHEVTKYATGPATGTGAWVVAMNKSRWNRLPAEVKSIVNDISEKHTLQYYRTWDAACDRGKKLFLKNGGQITKWKHGELEKLNQAMAPMWSDWIGKMNKQGLQGNKAAADLYAILKDMGVNNPAIGYTPGQ